LLVTGIADPKPLVLHARSLWDTVRHAAFPDHHAFSAADVERLAEAFATFAGPRKTIVTTEKDAVRLLPAIKGTVLEKVPIVVVPVKAVILNEPDRFFSLLREHVAAHSTHG
jgi:tetraacyldisaccharide 4'-kinase